MGGWVGRGWVGALVGRWVLQAGGWVGWCVGGSVGWMVSEILGERVCTRLPSNSQKNIQNLVAARFRTQTKDISGRSATVFYARNTASASISSLGLEL